MKRAHTMANRIRQLGLLVLTALSLGACAGALGLLGASWREEVLLHDGKKIVVERAVSRGGRHEIGQLPSYAEQTLTFTLSEAQREIVWEDRFSKDIGSASFLPMLLDVREGVAYLVAYPMGCLSYNKWGRPNPPYVVFGHDGKEWKRILLKDLPPQINTPNLIFSDPDNVVRRIGKSFIPAETIQRIISEYRQPEYRTILREALAKERINAMCMEMILYKGHWIMPNDPVARQMIDRDAK